MKLIFAGMNHSEVELLKAQPNSHELVQPMLPFLGQLSFVPCILLSYIITDKGEKFLKSLRY